MVVVVIEDDAEASQGHVAQKKIIRRMTFLLLWNFRHCHKVRLKWSQQNINCLPLDTLPLHVHRLSKRVTWTLPQNAEIIPIVLSHLCLEAPFCPYIIQGFVGMKCPHVAPSEALAQ